MAKSALADLESALRARRLDRTLTTALPPLDRTDPAAVLPLGIPALDAVLRGGLPRGQLSEVAGARSSGRTTLALRVLASATRRGELAALVDTFDRLDMDSVVAADVDVNRFLWIRGQAISKTQTVTDADWQPGISGDARPGARGGLLERTVDRALKSLNLVLQAGGFGVVAIDLADLPQAALRRIPTTTWLRVQRTIEASDTACVLVVPEPLARSAGGLTLSLVGEARWNGEAARARRWTGLELRVRVVSPRRRVDGEIVVVAGTRDVARDCGDVGDGREARAGRHVAAV